MGMSWLKAMREKEPPEPDNPIGTVVIGNLQPDRMDTPKNMVRRSLKRAQFKTLDHLLMRKLLLQRLKR